MKLYLDTANLEEIREAAGWGVLGGVTTNPSLIAREKRDFLPLIKEICSLVEGDVSVETTAKSEGALIQQGREIAAIAPNAVVKLAMSREGLRAAKQLRSEGIRVNMTLCFSVAQALLAAEAGAAFVSPFLGRLDDIGWEGMRLLSEIVEMYAVQGYETEVLAASLRHPVHVIEAARAGADIATMPFKVFTALVEHPLTDRGFERFIQDWEQAKPNLGELPPSMQEA